MRALVVVSEIGDQYLAYFIETLGVEFRRCGQVDQVAANRLELFDIAFQGARIVVPILVWSKLHRVDENAADTAVAQRLAFFD